MRAIVFSATAALAFAACSGSDEPAAAPTETSAASDAAPSASASTPTVATIPAALHGRWGLVPGDCTSTRGDAKGLLRIDAGSLRFYESEGRIGEVTAAGPTTLRASFTMQGEGMDWVREMELEVDGSTLKRREFGPEAAAEGFVYTRC